MCDYNKDKLYAAILSLKDKGECESLFSDLFTKKEIRELGSRLEVARLLSEGVNYNEIARLTGASTATISRVSKCLSGDAGGYRLVLPRIYEEGARVSMLVSLTPWCISAYRELRESWAELPELPREIGEESRSGGIKVSLVDPRDGAAIFSGGGYEIFLGSVLDISEEGLEYREIMKLRGFESLLLTKAVEKDEPIRVASAHPNLTRKLLGSAGYSATVVRARAEAALSLGGFDASTSVVSSDSPVEGALTSLRHSLVGRADLSSELLSYLAEKLGK